MLLSDQVQVASGEGTGLCRSLCHLPPLPYQDPRWVAVSPTASKSPLKLEQENGKVETGGIEDRVGLAWT
jgi:hypothetical protein